MVDCPVSEIVPLHLRLEGETQFSPSVPSTGLFEDLEAMHTVLGDDLKSAESAMQVPRSSGDCIEQAKLSIGRIYITVEPLDCGFSGKT